MNRLIRLPTRPQMLAMKLPVARKLMARDPGTKKLHAIIYRHPSEEAARTFLSAERAALGEEFKPKPKKVGA